MHDLAVQMAKDVHATLSLQADELIENMGDAIEHSVTGNLKKSLRKKDVTQKFGDIERPTILVMAGGPLTTKYEKSGPHDYAIDEEYGTRKEAPRPFFWSTARRYKAGKFMKDLFESVEETIERNNHMRQARADSNYTSGNLTVRYRYM
ncbi:HK97-gp10 family putative phage morphogenesis protein [Bradyrhizobium sp. JR3.5]